MKSKLHDTCFHAAHTQQDCPEDMSLTREALLVVVDTAVEGTCSGHASCFVKRLGLHIRRKVATEGIRGASFPGKSRPRNLRQCCARLRSLGLVASVGA